MKKDCNGNVLFEAGDVIPSQSLLPAQYTITEAVGSGAQGEVYFIKEAWGGSYKVLKTLQDTSAYYRIQQLKNNPNINAFSIAATDMYRFALPLALFSGVYAQSSYRGYVMDRIGDYSIQDAIQKGDINGMQDRERYILLRNICAAFDKLQMLGYCYQDISFTNIRFEESTLKACIIDCDNAAREGDARTANLSGTGWFVAPEVAFDQKSTSINSDDYALAALLFYILTKGHQSPYVGRLFYENGIGVPESSFDLRDELINHFPNNFKSKVIFVFDNLNNENSLTVTFPTPNSEIRRKNNEKLQSNLNEIMKNWDSIPDSLKNLFRQTFCQPFYPSRRAKAKEWVQAFNALLNISSTSAGFYPQRVVRSIVGDRHMAYILLNERRIDFDYAFGFVLRGEEVNRPDLHIILSIKPIMPDLGTVEFILSNECSYKIVVNNRDIIPSKAKIRLNGENRISSNELGFSLIFISR